MKAGDIISEDAVRSVRPGYGIPPKYLTEIIGQKVIQDAKKNTPVLNHHFKKTSFSFK